MKLSNDETQFEVVVNKDISKYLADRSMALDKAYMSPIKKRNITNEISSPIEVIPGHLMRMKSNSLRGGSINKIGYETA